MLQGLPNHIRSSLKTKAILSPSELNLMGCNIDIWRWLLFSVLCAALFALSMYLWISGLIESLREDGTTDERSHKGIPTEAFLGFALGGLAILMGFAACCSSNRPPHLAPRLIAFENQQLQPSRNAHGQPIPISPRILYEREISLGQVGVLDAEAHLDPTFNLPDDAAACLARAKVAGIALVVAGTLVLTWCFTCYFVSLVTAPLLIFLGIAVIGRCGGGVSSLLEDDVCNRDARGALSVLRALSWGSFFVSLVVASIFVSAMNNPLFGASRKTWIALAAIGGVFNFAAACICALLAFLLADVEEKVLDGQLFDGPALLPRFQGGPEAPIMEGLQL